MALTTLILFIEMSWADTNAPHAITNSDSLMQIIEMAKQDYANGSYTRAISTLGNVLEQLSGDARVEAHKYLAFSYVALGARDKAHEHFKKALRINPKLELSIYETTPEVLEAFANAKTERAHESAGCSCFIPGIGQLMKGEETKGKLIIATSALTFTAATVSWVVTDNKSNYYHSLGPDDNTHMDAAYEDYNKWYKTSLAASALFLSVYVYSIIDALSPGKIINTEHGFLLTVDEECITMGYITDF
jgi:tetratricopeptide (TPR) repeat protein